MIKMNKVILMGRLTRDPEVRYTQTNNTLVASFSLAVNRRFVRQGEERQADFVNIVAWSKLGEFCSKYFKKGQQVAVIGRLQTRTWDDDQGVKHYVTDFPSAEIAGVDKVITIPHLGASTEESEENCAEMAVDQLMNYLENGNIVNSVNYPNCDLGEASGAARITVHHKNLPNMIGQLTAILAADGHNISNMLNKSKGEWAYSMFDMEKKAPTEETIKKMEQIDGVVRVRVL